MKKKNTNKENKKGQDRKIIIPKGAELQAYLEERWKQRISAFLKDHQIKTEKGELLEFKNHKFLQDIFEDWTPIQTARKASQVGFSTMEILKSLYASKYKKWNIIYCLPTFNDVGQFVPSKVNPIIEQNPILAQWTRDKDTIFQKKVGERFIYYRGASSSKTEKEKMEAGTGIMFSADLILGDESDRSDQAILMQYDSRLEASDYKGKWYFSNPTHPGTLTQQLWDKSDQKHWFIECPHCRELQYLDYYENIDKERGIYICKKCHRGIDDDTRRNGQWVKRWHDREISGYWISHLICPWISAKSLIESEATKSKQYFYNFNLGLPYRGSDVVVDRQVILKNIVDNENFQLQNVIGVDTGLTMHYVLGNKQGIFKIGSTKDWDEIEMLMRKYEATAVFDALGDLTKPRQLRDKYRGRVWLCYFKRDKDRPEAIKWDSKDMAVYADRSKIIQRVIDDFVDSKIKFYLRPDELNEYISHWETLSQIEETDNIGITRKIWETEGENHLLFATIYFWLALQKSGEAKIIGYEAPDGTRKAHDPQAPSPVEMAEKMYEKHDWRT